GQSSEIYRRAGRHSLPRRQPGRARRGHQAVRHQAPHDDRDHGDREFREGGITRRHVRQTARRCQMTQQTSNVPVPTTGFGFTGPSLLAEGSVLCKWDNENGWHDRDGSAMPDPVIALGVRRGVRRWQNQELIEEIVDHPLPDCDKLNEAVPQSEWETGLNGEPQEPYKLWHAIYLLNPVDATVFSFLNCTVGISICAGRLESSLRAMQMMRGANAFPVCKLGDSTGNLT